MEENNKEEKTQSKSFFNKKTILGIIILLLIIGYGIYAKNQGKLTMAKLFPKTISRDEARAKIENLIKDSGGKATVKDVVEDGDLYKVTVSANGQDQSVYVTKDGMKFIPQVISFEDIAKQQKGAANSQQAAASKDVPKNDTPDVRLFVMSYCPYGTQMEKGILPVIAALGNKIKFSLEFVDYSMHNDKATNDRKELDENLRQYCIQKNEPAKLDAYLSCFLKKGQGTETSCMASAGVNATQVASCITQTDTQFDVAKDFNDQNTWNGGQYPPFNVNKDDNAKYGVQGSPTLVINDVEASAAGRDAASLLKIICGAFNNPPKECDAKLSTTAPASGFGDSAAAAGTDSASCTTPPAQ